MRAFQLLTFLDSSKFEHCVEGNSYWLPKDSVPQIITKGDEHHQDQGSTQTILKPDLAATFDDCLSLFPTYTRCVYIERERLYRAMFKTVSNQLLAQGGQAFPPRFSLKQRLRSSGTDDNHKSLRHYLRASLEVV